jgi:hypothetical protein
VSSTILAFSSQAVRALDKTNYPLVKFWNKASWKKHMKDTKDMTTVNQKAPKKGNTQAADGENVTMQFIEDANGRMIVRHRAGEIRKHAHSIFNDIAKWTTPPGTWGGVSSVMQDYYISRCIFVFQKCSTAIWTGKLRRSCLRPIHTGILRSQFSRVHDPLCPLRQNQRGKRRRH